MTSLASRASEMVFSKLKHEFWKKELWNVKGKNY
jgi:hypothetical protein